MTLRLRIRRGFTLLELLLVLALTGTILSIGLPLLDRSLTRAQFKSGVVELQTELQRTRLLAMKSGKVYVFRFLPGSGSYEVLTRDQYLARVDERFVKQTSGNVVFRVDHISDAPEQKPQGDSVFVDGQVEVDLGSRVIGSLMELPGETEPVDTWSQPIVFYPNGRTSQAIIQLESSGEYPLYSEIVLRGLTGAARVTAISVYPPGSPEFPGSLPTLSTKSSAPANQTVSTTQGIQTEAVEPESYGP